MQSREIGSRIAAYIIWEILCYTKLILSDMRHLCIIFSEGETTVHTYGSKNYQATKSSWSSSPIVDEKDRLHLMNDDR
jgi:hypothetical protein